MITHGGFFFANTFWAEAEGCGSLKDQLKCLSVELCCLKHLEQLLLYFGSQQIRNWGSKDGSVADYRGLKIAGEPCVWCGGGWGSLEKVGGWDLTSFLYQRLARIHHTYIYTVYRRYMNKQFQLIRGLALTTTRMSCALLMTSLQMARAWLEAKWLQVCFVSCWSFCSVWHVQLWS